MKSMKRFKESQEAVIKVREKRVSLEHTAKQRTEKWSSTPFDLFCLIAFPLFTTSNTKLVHLYRAEIYTQYLVRRCLATKKVHGLATTSTSLELFEGERKLWPVFAPVGPQRLEIVGVVLT